MTLDDIMALARPFPTWALEGETAACFFCAGFLGHNCEIHVHAAGLTAFCVDTDADRLGEMEALYPCSWLFVAGDAFEAMEQLRRADVITADPPLGLMERTFALRGMLRAKCDRLVLGIGDAQVAQAAYENAEIMPRAKGSWWAVW